MLFSDELFIRLQRFRAQRRGRWVSGAGLPSLLRGLFTRSTFDLSAADFYIWYCIMQLNRGNNNFHIAIMPTALIDRARECLLRNPEVKFTANEIASWVFKKYETEYLDKMNLSEADYSEADYIKKLSADVSSSKNRLLEKYPEIKTTEERPRKFYYTDTSDSDETEEFETEEASKSAQIPATATVETAQDRQPNEHELYPILTEFLRAELEIYSKRIDEKRSKNAKGPKGNHWLFPDVVAMEILSNDWDDKITECVTLYGDKKTQLWSFEVKIKVNRSNVREVFFQAVSNSSWANFGYLVASEIEGVETIKELRILSGVHGIGVIQLNVENPAESQIMIPAKERIEVDWNTANRLVEENTDFEQYIVKIRQFLKSSNKEDFNPIGWDTIIPED